MESTKNGAVVVLNRTEPTVLTVQLVPPAPEPQKEEEVFEGPPKPTWKDILYSKPWIKDVCGTCGVEEFFTKDFVIIMTRSKHAVYCTNGHNSTFDEDYLKNVTTKFDHSTENFAEITCNSCGVAFMLSKDHMAGLKESHAEWYCPNACKRWYPKPAPPPTPPKTEADVDYGKMIAYHDALGAIALTKPNKFKNKRLLKMVINIARNTLDLSKLKE